MFKLAPWFFLQLTLISTVFDVQAMSDNPSPVKRQLRQATRQQIVRRAIRATCTGAKRADPSALPVSISCGDGQTFTIAFSDSGTSFDGQYAVKNSDDGILATSQASAATFTLDSSCNLQDITDGHPLGLSTANAGQSNDYAYLLDPVLLQYFPSDYSRATCSIATTGEITCSAGQGTEFFAAGGTNSAYLFYGTDSFTGLPKVTLTAVLASN